MSNYNLQITSNSVEETRNLSQTLGALISRPLVIALMGDLGSGKTAFVQGLAKGLEVPDEYYITSPTFTLINEYPGRHPLVHVDLYRLEKIEDLMDIGLDEMLYAQAVIAIEWAEKLTDGLVPELLRINLDILDDYRRELTLNATGQDEVNLIIALKSQLNGNGFK